MAVTSAAVKLSEPPKSLDEQFVPVSQTVNILDTETARLYTHVHPMLIMGPLYFLFSQMVKDPIQFLSATIIPLSILQTAYCMTCLSPSSGCSTPQAKTPKRKRVSFAKSQINVQSKATTAAFSLFLTFSLATPVLTALLVLMGAPLLTHGWQNLLCATHMALLAVMPLFYVYGVDTRIWTEIAGAALPFDQVWGGTIGTFFGAWLGAIPIPLDWDRDWQTWPITIITGAYLGWSSFRLLGEYVWRGKRLSFD